MTAVFAAVVRWSTAYIAVPPLVMPRPLAKLPAGTDVTRVACAVPLPMELDGIE